MKWLLPAALVVFVVGMIVVTWVFYQDVTVWEPQKIEWRKKCKSLGGVPVATSASVLRGATTYSGFVCADIKTIKVE